MSYPILRRLSSIVLIALSSVTAAQAQNAGPIHSASEPSAMPYRSAFADYENYQETEMLPWHTANEIVGQAGGMAGHDMGKPGNATSAGKPTQGKATPAHDMSKMKGAGDMADTPGHDMSKMKPKAAPAATKPASTPIAPKATQDQATPAHDMSKMKGPDNMADMPGHDMSKMKPKVAPPPAKPAAAPAVPGAMESMPGHPTMQKQ